MKIDIEKLWYSKNILSIFLWPLSWLFRLITFFRRIYYKIFYSKSFGRTKIIIVGNITVGGTGKTPFVAYLSRLIQENGLKVGVISRGYGRVNENDLKEVQIDSDANEVGDEALMLKQQVSCPIAVAADRTEAARYLNKKYDLDVIISDDGLQHYKLPRDYEIIIVDGEREFGNGYCLPAGPLREPISRLNQADIVVSNGENGAYEYQYTSMNSTLVSLKDHSVTKTLKQFANVKVHAIAGIGNPKRFFAILENAGIRIVPHAFPDHHAYVQSDITFNDDLPVLMTEKDAVKCKKFKYRDAWFLPITAEPNDRLKIRITRLIEGLN